MGCASSAGAVGGVGNANDEEAKKISTKQRRKLSLAPGHVADITPGAAGGRMSDNLPQFSLTAKETEAKGTKVHALLSRKGFVPYSKKKVNQDRTVLKYAVGDDTGISLYGVMDGHGEFGHYVSSFVQTKLPEYLGKYVAELRKDPHKYMTQAVAEMCSELPDTSINISFSGTTLVFGVQIDEKMYVGNVGDSRCVLGQVDGDICKAKDLSFDQKPENPEEKQRILAAGGRVETLPGPPGEDCGPYRVWLREVDVPGLAMSRSIGDSVSQTVGVISVPEIIEHELTSTDLFAVWASDGVWEFMSSQDAVDVIYANMDNLDKAAALLVEEATKRWKREEEVIDDITVTIIQYNPKPKAPE